MKLNVAFFLVVVGLTLGTEAFSQFVLNADPAKKAEPEQLLKTYQDGRVDLDNISITHDPKMISQLLENLLTNKDNYLELENKDCHQSELAPKIDSLVRVGFFVRRITVQYSEQVQTRWTTFRRLFQNVTLELEHAKNDSNSQTLLSTCATNAWRK